MELTDHLFRQESGRMISSLVRVFGPHNLQLVEDVVQDSFFKAFEVWKIRGIPENPAAWLMTTAKNRAVDELRKERTARNYAPEIHKLLASESTQDAALDELLSADSINDGLLRTMFSCCHPDLAEEAQVALVLHILCGFSVAEIAGAFVCSFSAMEKRITRAKQVFAQSPQLFRVEQDDEFTARLPAVRRALYQLFNEGYHGASPKAMVRVELCREAMRLTAMLIEYSPSATPTTYALAALMCFHAARLPGRLDDSGEFHLLVEQDRSLWDAELIAEGFRLMEGSASGDELSEYHIECGIASYHAQADSVGATNWEAIIALYDRLYILHPSPVVALNRAIAISQLDGPERGLQEIHRISRKERLESYPFYFSAQGELELRLGEFEAARRHFETAKSLARNSTERQFMARRIEECQA